MPQDRTGAQARQKFSWVMTSTSLTKVDDRKNNCKEKNATISQVKGRDRN